MMRRREFLACTASAAAATGQGKKPIAIGVIGAAHSHADAKIRLLRDSSDWRLAGVSETDPKLRQELQRASIPLMDRSQMLADPDIQAIAVESAVSDHARDGRAVLEAGKHLHLEKAPAVNMADFRTIVDLARSRRLLLQVGYMWRYHPGAEKMLEAARQGWLGDIYLVKATIGNQLGAARRPEWAEFPGGVMFELGCHVIDVLVRLKGKPEKVTSFLRTDGGASDSLRDNTAAVFEWKDGLGMVQSTTLQPGSSRYRSIEFHGRNGSAVMRPIEPPELQVFLDKPAGPYQAGMQKVPLPSYTRYAEDLAELAAAVRGEKKLRVTAEEDLAVQETVLRASGMIR